MSNFLCHAIVAYTEKVHPVIQNFKTRLRFDFGFNVIQAIQVRVHNFLTLDTDHVRVGIGLVSIISVAAIREPELKNFTERLN